jgi:hypothetical protein
MTTKNTLAIAALAGILSVGAVSTGFISKANAGTHDKAANEQATEKHGCKGQNSCKGNGGCKTDKNACKGHNTCKGQGGCATDGSKK